MKKRTLLINNDYTPLTFLNERRVYKFLALDKVEVLSHWDDEIKVFDTYLNFPAVLRLKHQIKRSYKPVNYSKNVLIRRDNRTCQYCARVLADHEITIDHLVPKCKKGKETVWLHRICHQKIHSIWTEIELAKEFHIVK